MRKSTNYRIRNSKDISIRNNPLIIAKVSTAGITLVALVVTIIVLIILAGISINLILGDNGIIMKAKEARETTEQAMLNEEETLNLLDNYIENEGKIVIKGPVEGGSYDNPYIPTGFTHTQGDGTWNSGYTIKDALENEFVWVPCVTDQTKVKEGDTVVTFGKTLPTLKEDGTIDTSDPYYMYNMRNYGLLPADTSVATEDNSVAEIEVSVGKYGGFYIAKYEAGIEGTEENYDFSTATGRTVTDGSVKPLSQPGKGVWNYITRTEAITVSKSMIDELATGAKSTLISGAAWDTTLQWLVNTSDNKVVNAGYDTDSTGKGWYREVSYNSTISSYICHTTGYYAVNNIYDMAGNVWDWTTENCIYNGNSYLIGRGGSKSDTGLGIAAAGRHIDYGDRANISIGFRVALYK